MPTTTIINLKSFLQMNWLYIVFGLIAMAVCIFLIYAATKAHVWYEHYANGKPLPQNETPNDLWIILIAIGSIFSISIFALLAGIGSLFAIVAGFVLLGFVIAGTLKKERKQNAFYPVMYWSVGLGAVLGVLTGFAMFIFGFLPSKVVTPATNAVIVKV